MLFRSAIHIGLTARVAAHESKQARVDGGEREIASRAWRKFEQAAEALDQADEAEDFQAVGMRLREALIAFVQEIGAPAMVTPGETAPQRSNVKSWMGLICQAIAAGGHNEQVRSYLRKTADETWDLVNWLTHASNASRFDGIIALDATSSLLATFSMAVIRHEDLDKPLEFNLCEACGWQQLTERAR